MASPVQASPAKPPSQHILSLAKHTRFSLVLAGVLLTACLCAWAGAVARSAAGLDLGAGAQPKFAWSRTAVRQLAGASGVAQLRTGSIRSNSYSSVSYEGEGLSGLVEQQRKAPGSVECGVRLQIPKVALLFLTRGPMPLEDIWKTWFQGVQGVVPRKQVQAAGCSEETLALVLESCAGPRSDNAINNQHLFSVYLHTHPDFPDYEKQSVFYGRQLPLEQRIAVEWGSHSMTQATRNLMRAALAEPLNTRFVLLSELCLPLYPAATLYVQLLTEDLSRVNACGPGPLNWTMNTDVRWQPGMESEHLHREDWRKSQQWVALTRPHAVLVGEEETVEPLFEQHCRNVWDDELDIHTICYSDEHYIPTMLAALGRENETDCWGQLTYAKWNDNGPHPRIIMPEEITAEGFRALRKGSYEDIGELHQPCDAEAAIRSATAMLVPAAEISPDACPEQPILSVYTPLGPHCPLIARKFSPDTLPALRDLVSSCLESPYASPGADCQEPPAPVPQVVVGVEVVLQPF